MKRNRLAIKKMRVMSTQENQKRARGRPRGSTTPSQFQKKRKDYRFSSDTLKLLEQGQLIASVELQQKINQTDFVELAIQHYYAELAWKTQQQEYAAREIEHLQAYIHELEQDLQRAQIMLKQAGVNYEKQPARQETPQQILSGLQLPFYQIIIRHNASSCPALPDGFSYIDRGHIYDPDGTYYYVDKGHEYNSYEIYQLKCPAHEVFSCRCSIDFARQKIEELKKVEGIIWIRLEKNAYPVPDNTWQKRESVWARK